ncbi:MAG: Dabb family protein [Actinobacteria bacterium]|nr:Dabb family protein [Actinomycetota bacterium]
MVIFCLKKGKDSPETVKFLQDTESILSCIPNVKNFKLFRQTNPRNDYHFGFYMEFDNNSAYDEYTKHPSHINYVKQKWEKEVKRFMEIDFETI